jgi:hypothetical protein
MQNKSKAAPQMVELKSDSDNKIVGVQSRNKCSLWNVKRKEWVGLFV